MACGPVRVRFDAQGVLAGSKDASRCIGYLTKYLTKRVGECHRADTDPQRAHAARLAEALRYQPCSPRCANWLRYGIQPKDARPGLVPGRCRQLDSWPLLYFAAVRHRERPRPAVESDLGRGGEI